MKLWRVDMPEVTLYVAAESEIEAEDIGDARLEDAIRDARPPVFATHVTRIEQVEPDWREALPYSEDGEDGDRADATCAEILAGFCAHGTARDLVCHACAEATGQLRLLPEGA